VGIISEFIPLVVAGPLTALLQIWIRRRGRVEEEQVRRRLQREVFFGDKDRAELLKAIEEASKLAPEKWPTESFGLV
jgi:ribose 1,5-bisphosphokinase PhnN